MSREKKKSILIYTFSGLLLVSLMTFSSTRVNNRKVEELRIEVVEEDGNYFTDDLEVIDLLTNQSNDFVVGAEIGNLRPKMLELRVEANPFVKEAQVYRDIEGKLQVYVEQSKPIARVFTNGKKDQYIDTEGRILPVNAKHTARVPILETAFPFEWKSMRESSYSQQVFELLKYVEKDKFWKAQVSHIIVKDNGEIVLFPQVTKQKIEFGKPTDIEEKFSKLMTFYKGILPKRGWNAYKRVNVKFKNQIICE